MVEVCYHCYCRGYTAGRGPADRLRGHRLAVKQKEIHSV
jgi:hypothetical protein